MICDSSDAIGRPFPFALIGEGKIKGWEKCWPRLARELNKTWSALEYIAAHCYESTRELVDALERVGAPECEMTAAKADVDRPIGGPNASVPPSTGLSEADGPVVFHLGRDSQEPVTQAEEIMRQQSVLQPRQFPNAVFLGGTLEQTCLALVQRPLRNADFITLWRI